MKKLLFVLAVAAVIAGAFVGGYQLRDKQFNDEYNKATQPATALLDGILQGGDDLNAAYDSTSPGYRGRVNRDDFIKLITPALSGELQSSSIYIGDSDNRISYEVAGKDSKTYEITVVTQKDGDNSIVIQDVTFAEKK